jgi:hypothetical protein
MVELYFIVMSVTVVLAGALSLILYLDRIPARFPPPHVNRYYPMAQGTRNPKYVGMCPSPLNHGPIRRQLHVGLRLARCLRFRCHQELVVLTVTRNVAQYHATWS